MKILLVQPKVHRRPMDTGLKAKMSPSLGLLTLKKLTPPHHQVVLINENIEEIDFNMQVDLVAVTITVDALKRGGEIAKEFRQKGIPVVAGGIHITGAAETARGLFTSLCLGRGEATWPLVLNDVEKGTLKAEYKDLYQDTFLSSPDYAIPNNKKYIHINVISTSRGCPYQCDFCYNSNDNAVPYTNRPIRDVLEDIKRVNQKHIMFIDDNFCGNPAWTKAFLKEIIPLNITWGAAVCADVAKDSAMLDLLAESGCKSLFIGFESINASSLAGVHKVQNRVEDFSQLVQEIHKRGIMVNASLVFGLPDDDPSTFQRTVDWLVEHKISTATAHILTPYPGTALYDRMAGKGQITDFDLAHYDTSHVVFQPEKMTQKELYKGYLDFYKNFYSTKNILRRLPEDQKQRLPFLFFNFFYRKWGGFTQLLAKIIPLQSLGALATRLSFGSGKGK